MVTASTVATVQLYSGTVDMRGLYSYVPVHTVSVHGGYRYVVAAVYTVLLLDLIVSCCYGCIHYSTLAGSR